MNQREMIGELISAYLDGELSGDEKARVESLLSTSESHQRELEDLRAVSADLAQLPQHRLDEEFAQRVIEQVDDQVRPRTVRSDLPQSRTHRWNWRLVVAASVAATALAAFLVVQLSELPSPQVATQSDAAKASSEPEYNSPTSTKAASEVPRHATADHEAAVDGAAANRREMAGDAVAGDAAQPLQRTEARGGKAVARQANATVAAQAETDALPHAQAPVPPGTGQLTRAGDAASQVESAGDAAPAGSERPAKVNLGPGLLTQRISLVLDVTLADNDSAVRTFERLLREAGVTFDANIAVKKELEASLLASRYFEPAEAEEAEGQYSVVFVVSPARAIDQVWRRLKQDPMTFARVDMDIALQPSDASVFLKLRKLSDALTTDRAAAAHRLELPINRAIGPAPRQQVGGVAGATPPAGAGGGLLGGNMQMDTIIVLRQPSGE